MKQSIFIFCLVLPSLLYSQANVDIVKFDTINKILTTPSKKIQVVNFWATWCGPCVEELPYFQNVLETQKQKVDMHFVSLDFAPKIEHVNSFANAHSLKGDLLLLDEIDYNSWIERVDPNWSGAIPATLFINTDTGQRVFIEHELTEAEIIETIKSLSH